ncbi:Si-specific NAD(P)(+) transhydrogenase [bacterium]|nr:Si-specific NAD(P)(+) transhydrogenase [bacterium]
MKTLQYDFVSIGSGPAGQRAAVQAAKEGARAAIVDRRPRVGGVSLHAGTVPSKSLREAILFYTEFRQRPIYGESRNYHQVTLTELVERVDKVLTHEMAIMDNQLRRNHVDLISGEASFVDARSLEVKSIDDDSLRRIEAKNILIATGTQPRWPDEVPFDQEVIFDSNFIFSTRNIRAELPRSLIVVGGGVIGTEYACIFATLGCQVYVVDTRKEILGFLDREITQHLLGAMEEQGIQLLLGTEVAHIARTSENRGRVELANGVILESDAVLFAVGRTPCIESLHLENTQVKVGKYSTISVDENFETDEPGVYAAGDVIGFPALSSTSSEQGRLAARHALGIPSHRRSPLLPFAIYTIPEISMVGKTEAELTVEGIPYVKGIAPYRENGKAAIIGTTTGALKLLFHKHTRKLLGAHVMGELASELIHVALVTMSLEGTIDVFVDNVFNSPTLTEIYKAAALNGLNRLEGKTTQQFF